MPKGMSQPFLKCAPHPQNPPNRGGESVLLSAFQVRLLRDHRFLRAGLTGKLLCFLLGGGGSRVGGSKLHGHLFAPTEERDNVHDEIIAKSRA